MDKLSGNSCTKKINKDNFNERYVKAIFEKLDKNKTYFTKEEVEYFLSKSMQNNSDYFDIEGFFHKGIAKKQDYKVSMDMLKKAYAQAKNLDTDTSVDPEIFNRGGSAMKHVATESMLSQVIREEHTKYALIRYPDTAISYIKNDGNGWEHIYDRSYGYKGPVDKDDMQYASHIEKEKIPSRTTRPKTLSICFAKVSSPSASLVDFTSISCR